MRQVAATQAHSRNGNRLHAITIKAHCRTAAIASAWIAVNSETKALACVSCTYAMSKDLGRKHKRRFIYRELASNLQITPPLVTNLQKQRVQHSYGTHRL